MRSGSACLLRHCRCGGGRKHARVGGFRCTDAQPLHMHCCLESASYSRQVALQTRTAVTATMFGIQILAPSTATTVAQPHHTSTATWGLVVHKWHGTCMFEDVPNMACSSQVPNLPNNVTRFVLVAHDDCHMQQGQTWSHFWADVACQPQGVAWQQCMCVFTCVSEE